MRALIVVGVLALLTLGGWWAWQTWQAPKPEPGIALGGAGAVRGPGAGRGPGTGPGTATGPGTETGTGTGASAGQSGASGSGGTTNAGATTAVAQPAGQPPAGSAAARQARGGAKGGSGRAGQPGAAGDRPIPVLVGAVRTADVDVILNALGTVTARSTVTVRSRVDGQLVRLGFDEGQVVSKGQLLAEIDPRPFQVELAQAEGQLARDRAQLQNAQTDLERYRGLLAKDSIARQQVDNQVALVRQLQGTVAADQGQVDSAKLQLSFTRITAPIGGRVGLRQVDPGNMIRASDANGLVVITEVQPIAVTFALPSDNIAELAQSLTRAEAPVTEAWDRRGDRMIASGSLRSIDNQIDVTTGTIRLKAEFENRDNGLFPNQFVNVKLRLRTIKDATVMSPAAVQRSSTGTYVFVIDGQSRIGTRKVVLGQATESQVVVTSGVAPGDRVVVDGADRVRDGQLVEAVSRPGET